MALLLLLLACLLSNTAALPTDATTTIAVPLGDTLTITVDLNGTENRMFWWKGRLWDENRGDGIGVGGNCSAHPQLANRLLSCNATLILTNMTYQDAGLYRFRYRHNKTLSDYYTFNVTVFESQPVMALMSMLRTHFTVQCWDLRNPLANMTLELKPVSGAPPFKIRQTCVNCYELNIELIDGRYMVDDEAWYAKAYGRCCAAFYNVSFCSPWRFMTHNLFLSTRNNRGRPWCSYPDLGSLNNVDFNVAHVGPLFKSTCHKTLFPTSYHEHQLCEGVKSTILDTQNLPKLSWKMPRPLGGVRTVATGLTYELTPHMNDTGAYYVVGHNQTTNFSLYVRPTLRVALDIIQLGNSDIMLNCSHNGGPDATVTWEVKGTYSQYKTDNHKLTIWMDCWKDRIWWYYKFGIRCHVEDDAWSGYSRWALASVKRTDHTLVGRRGFM